MNIELRIIYYKASNQSWLYKFKDNVGNLITKDQDTVEYIQSLEAQLKSKNELLMEAYESIDEVLNIQERTYGYGMDLHLDMITFADKSKQLHSKAQDYISKES